MQVVCVFTVNAAGKMVVPIEEYVSLEIEKPQTNENYKWTVVSPNEEIINVNEGQYFRYLFKESGLYTINLQVTDTFTNEITISTVEVDVGGNFFSNQNDIVSASVIKTAPAADNTNTIHLPSNGGEVIYYAFPEEGIQEFIVDKDLTDDSNLDLDPTNDIDNEESLLLKPYTTNYSNTSNLQSKVTISTSNGNKQVQQFNIVFDKQINTNPPQIQLITNPPSSNEAAITLAPENPNVYFDLSSSIGDIIEYRIDTNIFIDSDQNGDPTDDIDNFNHLSFQTGIPFLVDYSPQTEKIVAQFTVINAAGQGSQIQKQIRFENQKSFVADFTFEPKEITIDEEIRFSNSSLNPDQEVLAYGWDFDGDGILDHKSTQQEDVIFVYAFPGEYTITLYARNKNGDFDIKEQIITVKEKEVLPIIDEGLENGPIAYFEATIDFNTVDFTTPTSETIAGTLTYSWNFGDSNTANGETTTHTYETIGTYLVTLEVTDSQGRSNTQTREIEIQELKTVDNNELPPSCSDDDCKQQNETPDEPIAPEKANTGESNLLWTIGIILMGLIAFLFGATIISLVVGIYYFKMKHPEYTFADAWIELKDNIQQKVSGNKKLPEVAKTQIVQKELKKDSSNAPQQQKTPDTNEKKPPLVIDSKAPDWLKTDDQKAPKKEEMNQSDVKKDSVKKEEPDQNKALEKKPLFLKDDIPDWLKPPTNNTPTTLEKVETKIEPPSEAKNQIAKKDIENKPTENKPTENKPTENKPTENKPTENKPQLQEQKNESNESNQKDNVNDDEHDWLLDDDDDEDFDILDTPENVVVREENNVVEKNTPSPSPSTQKKEVPDWLKKAQSSSEENKDQTNKTTPDQLEKKDQSAHKQSLQVQSNNNAEPQIVKNSSDQNTNVGQNSPQKNSSEEKKNDLKKEDIDKDNASKDQNLQNTIEQKIPTQESANKKTSAEITPKTSAPSKPENDKEIQQQTGENKTNTPTQKQVVNNNKPQHNTPDWLKKGLQTKKDNSNKGNARDTQQKNSKQPIQDNGEIKNAPQKNAFEQTHTKPQVSPNHAIQNTNTQKPQPNNPIKKHSDSTQNNESVEQNPRNKENQKKPSNEINTNTEQKNIAQPKIPKKDNEQQAHLLEKSGQNETTTPKNNQPNTAQKQIPDWLKKGINTENSKSDSHKDSNSGPQKKDDGPQLFDIPKA